MCIHSLVNRMLVIKKQIWCVTLHFPANSKVVLSSWWRTRRADSTLKGPHFQSVCHKLRNTSGETWFSSGQEEKQNKLCCKVKILTSAFWDAVEWMCTYTNILSYIPPDRKHVHVGLHHSQQEFLRVSVSHVCIVINTHWLLHHPGALITHQHLIWF